MVIVAADFLRGRVGQMIDPRHPLAALSSRMPCEAGEAAVLVQRFAHPVREGNRLGGVDLLRPATQRSVQEVRRRVGRAC
jgi:IS5 family transposase